MLSFSEVVISPRSRSLHALPSVPPAYMSTKNIFTTDLDLIYLICPIEKKKSSCVSQIIIIISCDINLDDPVQPQTDLSQ